MSGRRSSGSAGIRTYPPFRKGMFLLRFLTQLREWYIIRQLRSLFRDSDMRSVLDAGCGYGEYAYFIASRFPGVDVTALEMDGRLAGDLAEFIRRVGLGNIHVAEGDVLGLETNGEFDLVLCGSVLEHIEEDEAALARLTAALRPGGVLLVYVPTSARRILPHFRRLEAEGKLAGERHFGHVRSYTEPELVDKLRDAGLVVRQGTRTYGFFGALAYEILYTFMPHSSRFSRKHWLILPPYFLLLHPFVLLLMCIDLLRHNTWGNGLMVMAEKPR